MLGRNRVKQVMHSRLPPFERPRCQLPSCPSALEEPRPIHTEAQGAAGVLKVHCLTRCPRCATQYKGERMIGLGKQTRALEQSFHIYNDEDRVFLSSILAKYQQSPEKVAKINAMEVRG